MYVADQQKHIGKIRPSCIIYLDWTRITQRSRSNKENRFRLESSGV